VLTQHRKIILQISLN